MEQKRHLFKVEKFGNQQKKRRNDDGNANVTEGKRTVRDDNSLHSMVLSELQVQAANRTIHCRCGKTHAE